MARSPFQTSPSDLSSSKRRPSQGFTWRPFGKQANPLTTKTATADRSMSFQLGHRSTNRHLCAASRRPALPRRNRLSRARRALARRWPQTRTVPSDRYPGSALCRHHQSRRHLLSQRLESKVTLRRQARRRSPSPSKSATAWSLSAISKSARSPSNPKLNSSIVIETRPALRLSH